MIDPKLIDFIHPEPTGYPDNLSAGDTRDILWDAAGGKDGAAREFPANLWVEPRNWKEFAAETDRLKTWPINFLDRTTNQSPTHECTTHALRAILESAWNRQRNIILGPPRPGQLLDISKTSASVWFSCLSIYAEANPRQWGGAGTRQVIEIAFKRGILPDLIQPVDRKFKHALVGTCGEGNATQSSGKWVPLSKFPDGWKDTARLFRPVEIIFPESWEQIVCLLMHGYGVGVGRKQHSIPYMRWLDDEQVIEYPDSYDIMRYDSVRMIKSAVGGAYAVASMTVPDDWTVLAA